jgi:hypothetical protein
MTASNINLASIVENFGENGHIVGFANKYYTLWSYQITRNEATNALTFDAYFIKNLGEHNRFDGVYPFEASLKGQEIHINGGLEGSGLNLTKQEIKALKFSKSPMYNSVIADCDNLSLLCWKYNHRAIKIDMPLERQNAELANIANRAIELGAVSLDYFEHGKRLYTPEEVDTTKFSRKPEHNTVIAWCNDCGLLCWKYNNKAVDTCRPQEIQTGELENIKARALELGAVEIDNRLYSPEDQEKEWFKEMIATDKAVAENAPVVTTPKYNISVDGELQVGNYRFFFAHKYYRGTYYGPEHSFPLDSKGVAKQIKGKTISINSYEATTTEDGRSLYKVISWNFVK